ncbi:MAG: hypothetical protein SV377_08345 [Halobacteria archaeon]|nr:hypothetical protein [Halobacteria archaeon]
MSWYAFDAIDDSVEAIKKLLLPFDLSKWARLAFIMFFLGAGGFSSPTSFTGQPPSTGPGGGGFDGDISEIIPPIEIIAAVVIVILVIGLIYSIIGAIMEFVFVDSLRKREVHVRRYFRKRVRKGLHLFAFQLAIGLPTFLLVAGAIGAFFLPFLGFPRAWFGLLILLIPLIAVVVFVGGIVLGLTIDFVVQIMVSEDTGIISAWKLFWPLLKSDWKQYALYVVIRFFIGIGVGIIRGLVVLVAALIIGIPFGIIGIALLFAGTFILAAIVFILYALVMVVVFLFIQVPFMSYLRYYTMLVLGDSSSEFDLIPDLREEIRGEEA